jgi:hypothetical protein
MKVLEILADKNVSAKTIQRILQTGKPNFNIYMACQHELAQAEDILDLINRINEKYPDFINKNTYNEIVNGLFKAKRKQLDEHLQITYNVDTTSMTVSQIQEMLNMSFTEAETTNTLIPANNTLWETLDYKTRDNPNITISAILYSEKVSVKTLQQILKTANLGSGGYETCMSDLAPIEDALNFIKRTKQEYDKFSEVETITHKHLINDLLLYKSFQIKMYIQKTYNLDTDDMTQAQIKETLGINYPDYK